MAIFKNIVNYPPSTHFHSPNYVFFITQGVPQITNIVALFAPTLDFCGNKAELNRYTWMRPI